MSLRRASISLVLLSIVSQIAAASISAPDSHAQYSPDGKRILVMISNNPGWDSTREFTLRDGRIVVMREIFPKSGCYDAATLQPIWQVNWFTFSWYLQSSPDFTEVARLFPKAMLGGPALEFYKEGKVVRSYTCDDLLQHLNSYAFVSFTSAGWHHEWYDYRDFRQTGGGLNLSTGRRLFWLMGHGYDLGYQEHYTFDLATGQVRSCTYSGVDQLLMMLTKTAAITIAVPVTCWWLIRWLRRRLRALAIRATHCRNCAYDLTGNLSGVCPECGLKRTDLPPLPPPPSTRPIPACHDP
jgi:hypothetical protein